MDDDEKKFDQLFYADENMALGGNLVFMAHKN